MTAAFLIAASPGRAHWQRVLEDSFNGDSTNAWTYQGVTNLNGLSLMVWDPTNENIHAEWDQTNFYGAVGDPVTILPSRLSRSLERVLTDRDTFRFGATLRLATGSVANTIEYFEIANIGLYDLGSMGPDRAMSDDWTWNSTLVKDGSDFIEFNYWIGNNASWGWYPSAEATMGAHIDGLYGDYYFNWSGLGDPLWHSTSMGQDRWLPEGTDLFVQVVYYGAATNSYARRAYTAIYTDPARTQFVQVNGVDMYYWTVPLPTDRWFRLTDLAFFNYAQTNYTGTNGPAGAGVGTFDNVYVEQYFEPCEIFTNHIEALGFVAAWAAETGKTYYVEFTTNLAAQTWTTSAVVVASGETASCTNAADGKGGYYRVTQ